MITVSILGVGARGGEAYGRNIHALPDKYKIVSLCDASKVRLDKYGKAFEVPIEDRFLDENEFFKQKRSDLLIISTLDQDHVRQAKKAIELKYDIMLEKPISDKKEELLELLDLAEKSGVTIFVCHVLRYTPMIRKLKSILDSGVIGRIIHIDQTEHVGFGHTSHSFVRGNWRRRDETTFMIMAKCCHDMDLLQYFAGAKCDKLSSFGDLNFFKPECAPEGCANRCVNCKYVNTCEFSAKRIYIDNWKAFGSPANAWPFNVIVDDEVLTEQNLTNAITVGPYGRCVFACDNDVVDNQIVNMQFENGITASLKMIAFTKEGGREIYFYGTKGELVLNEDLDFIEVRPFFGENTKYRLSDITESMTGHAGGDVGLVKKMYEILTSDDKNMETSLERSIYSHLMAIAAEESRLSGGKIVKM